VSSPVLRETDPRVIEDLERILAPERVLTRPIDRLGRSADASIYRLIPQAIVRPRGVAEVRELFGWARQKQRHLTFRTAGTSLNGQAVSDDVLVELAPFFRQARVLDDGARIWTEPGVVGSHLNRLLARHRRRIGPDPASIDAAMIGGILANNSSGMCCGVAQNSYHTLESLVMVLACGAVVAPASPTPTTSCAVRSPRSTRSSWRYATTSGATRRSRAGSAASSRPRTRAATA
jgi:D-lactate dehydrogenase